MVTLMLRMGLFFICLMSASGFCADILKWVDESGKTHYGDRSPNSREIEQLEISVESFSSVNVREMNKDDMAVLSRESEQQGSMKKVLMYSTENCGYCKKAKAYFDLNKIDYTEHDINKSAAAKRQWKKLNGTGVPLILVGERMMRGFSVSSFENIYYN